ncbi:MAG: hypothetical protein KME03_07300 [Aphanocapsa lilacina HA4352-LM1]|jgi:type II secretory pathway pseudopilin PulG|uniref:Gll3882 protein n=2 Tax=Gloeobacter TaxID=33071 RepID=Q7NEJ7_GLOVI|nr:MULTISPECIES: hypothetical protein [Gloeobacter]MBW4697690.1 hypothetical protein [Aphanocapsa lilacina HA4352-LM1]UFP94379.1 hypothetical protein ISF26_21985 [Gloeobacter morelensis MG652769]BAC91823.1 gll3882 [Gloeobacter violaceus PCC 7421]
MSQLNVRKRNRRGVTVIELTIAMIVLIFLALASFFTLSSLSSDSKAEATVAALEKMMQWRDSVVARGDTTSIGAFNALSGPEDAANIEILKPVLGTNFRPLPMQISLTDLCNPDNKVPGNIKNRAAAALGQASATNTCSASSVSGTGFGEGAYPVVSQTGGVGTSPFTAAL